ncbi:oxygen-dependent coproporphyrinogen oxidase [Sphingobacterium spiritivorum]|uniref:coproporphyrinogen oxidase n=1 Tax=Sphingobacterium spiritivorum ATCC 33861 TaxID=525373 RepID=D7VRU7_SPHSI|nr:oxygen-dependent coproporphyrinogen oxidase [Sphingobacterium spiritivorum]EFK56498.1 coproporphyrinogen III oxidase, aerobic [Sphingobacterium spiritivorum ATCC 33861]QQT35437.1 oxygen-dependent coproporphyrinogen oxidase [Sphingobacterium spiritivorum]WQD32124.1 oxygen-dependent coproporphyrinogen oxidase [Sphingobacterium spiritivorum]SUJ05847.1 Coproporphyrinogen-III oxidase, aerobic [Sphingobacterium spiritivorum]
MITKEQIAETYKSIQQEITDALEVLDGGAKFQEELWERDGGGGGRTRIIQAGNLIEKGGVNFSAVHGTLPEPVKKAFGVEDDQFFATGVSIVLHPNHPLVPIIHMNIRYFELNEQTRWFGGGIDLTPHYVCKEDAQHFHQTLKAVCDKHNSEFYSEFKTWADNYFFIRHRDETRGIGGVFYDRLTPEKTNMSYKQIFDFSCDLGRTFAGVYAELANRHRHESYSEEQKNWQMLRRGRYVEFNLVYDAGTKFGLETNGRIESILMSLPAQANWAYDFKAQPGSKEEETLSLLKKGIDWA